MDVRQVMSKNHPHRRAQAPAASLVDPTRHRKKVPSLGGVHHKFFPKPEQESVLPNSFDKASVTLVPKPAEDISYGYARKSLQQTTKQTKSGNVWKFHTVTTQDSSPEGKVGLTYKRQLTQYLFVPE